MFEKIGEEHLPKLLLEWKLPEKRRPKTALLNEIKKLCQKEICI